MSTPLSTLRTMVVSFMCSRSDMTNRTNYVQADCLEGQGANGREFIGIFDDEPAEIRPLIRESKYNLCPACARSKAFELAGYEEPETKHWEAAIELMEYQISCLDRQKPGFVPPIPAMRHFVATPT